MDYHDVLSAVWTLILTAPIHCRGSIGEQCDVMLNFSYFQKKQICLHIGWIFNQTINNLDKIALKSA